MRVYISGPITGHEKTARWNFADAVKTMYHHFGTDIEIINPFEIGKEAGFMARLTHTEYMEMAFLLMTFCDTIYFMPGWETSKGCQMERIYAENRGMRILEGTENDNKNGN